MIPRGLVLVSMVGAVASALISYAFARLDAAELLLDRFSPAVIAPNMDDRPIQIRREPALQFPPAAGAAAGMMRQSPFDPDRRAFQRLIAPAPQPVPEIVAPPPKVLGFLTRDGAQTALVQVGAGKPMSITVGDDIEFGRVVDIADGVVVFDTPSGQKRISIFE